MSGDLPEATRRRIDAAMLESLAGTFRILNEGGPFICSFNFEDVSLMLDRVAELVQPGPVELLQARPHPPKGGA